ncbi:MAG: VanZ family protein [Acidobacteria bacterium]|nr:VanZ family protein [Acidobacteriota bacterium]
MFLYATTWPWSDFQGHSHWDRINWRPFAGAGENLREVALNVLLFIPFGYLHVRLSTLPERAAVMKAASLACVLSVSVEILQVFMHNHFASVTDVAMGVSGALVGGFLAVRGRH